MDYMTELKTIAINNGGIIETKIAAEHGISKAMLYKLCKENKIKCVIELKYTNGINTNDTSKIDGLIKIIKDNQMMDQVFILTSMRNCLLYIKDKYPLMNLVLLTGEATTNMESVEFCIENKMSLDGYYPYMSQEIIDTSLAMFNADWITLNEI